VIWAVAFNAGEGSPAVGAHIASNNRNRYRPAAAAEALYDPGHRRALPGVFQQPLPVGYAPRILNKYYGRGTSADNLVIWKVTRTARCT
jgi:hypothetical protein